MSLTLGAGSYVATWDLSSNFTGSCGLTSTTNVTPMFAGDSSALVTVGSGETLFHYSMQRKWVGRIGAVDSDSYSVPITPTC